MNESTQVATNQVGNKSFITTWLLSLLLGSLGVDRFYLGKIGTGILKLITIGGLGIWYLIDLILILTNAMTDKQGRKLAGYDTGNNKRVALFVTLGVLVLSILLGGISGAHSGNEATSNAVNDGAAQQSTSEQTTTNTSTPVTDTPTPTTSNTPTPTTKPASATVSQKNALAKAKSYLGYTAFSHDGLVDQLEYEKFSHDDAVYGADNSGADWNEQAAKKAKSYMDYTSFSRQGMIDQLVYDKFTPEQAAHGADSVGL